MAPEADSGPEGGTPQDAPEGWRWVEDAAGRILPRTLIMPDPDHPLYRPIARRNARRAAETERRIAADPDVVAALTALRERYDPVLLEYRRLRGEGDDTGARNYLAAYMPAATAEVMRVAEVVGAATGQPVHARSAYLWRHLWPLEEAGQHGPEDMESVTLVANASHVPAQFTLGPKEIALRFTYASEKDRQLLEKLITRAQGWLGLPRQGGGRPKRPDPAERPGADPRFVAKLHYWLGLEPAAIAEVLSWAYPDDGWLRSFEKPSDSRPTQRVGRHIEDGDAALRQEIGSDWRERGANGRTP